jgi:hypothetical protein
MFFGFVRGCGWGAWSLDSGRVRLTAYIVTAAWSVVLFLAGVSVPGAWSKVVSAIPAVVVGLFAVFDNWAWRWPKMRRLVRRPVLRGTWQGSLVSYRFNAEGKEERTAPIPIFLVIDQSYLKLSVSLLSAESKSLTIGSFMQRTGQDEFEVYYHYANTPRMSVRDRSPRHAGGSRIEISGLDPAQIDGEYWTDRKTRGTYEVTRASKKRYGTWAAASRELSAGTR